MLIAITGIIDTLLKIHLLRLQGMTPEQMDAEIKRHDEAIAPFRRLWGKITNQGEQT